MVKFHISPDGVARRCNAGSGEKSLGCKYGYSEENHYNSKEEAEKYFEHSNMDNLFKKISKQKGSENFKQVNYASGFDLKNESFVFEDELYDDFGNVVDENGKKITYGFYDFDDSVENYDLTFDGPDIPTCQFEHNDDDNSEFYRFEQIADLIEEYSVNDVKPGYALQDVELNTMQAYVSEQIVNEYSLEKNPFVKSNYTYSEEYVDESFPIVAIIKNKPFIIDGNHRFAAAKKNNFIAFAAVVVEFSEDGEDFYDVSPEEFNYRFQKTKL